MAVYSLLVTHSCGEKVFKIGVEEAGNATTFSSPLFAGSIITIGDTNEDVVQQQYNVSAAFPKLEFRARRVHRN